MGVDFNVMSHCRLLANRDGVSSHDVIEQDPRLVSEHLKRRLDRIKTHRNRSEDIVLLFLERVWVSSHTTFEHRW